MNFNWKACLGLALAGGLLAGLSTRHWVARTSLYVPAANRKLLAQLAQSLKTQPLEQEMLDELPPTMPETDSMDVVAAILGSRQACAYALEQSGLPATALERLHGRVSVPKVTRSTLVLEVQGDNSSQAMNLCNGLLKYYSAETNLYSLTTTSLARKRLQERCDKQLAQIRSMEKDLSRLSNIQMRRLGDKLIRPQGQTRSLIEYQRLARSEAVRDVLHNLRKVRRETSDSETANPGGLDPLTSTLAEKPGKRADALEQSSLTVRYQDLAERLSLERRYEDAVALYRNQQIEAELLLTLEALESRALEIVEPVSVERRYSAPAVLAGTIVGMLLGALFTRRSAH